MAPDRCRRHERRQEPGSGSAAQRCPCPQLLHPHAAPSGCCHPSPGGSLDTGGFLAPPRVLPRCLASSVLTPTYSRETESQAGAGTGDTLPSRPHGDNRAPGPALTSCFGAGGDRLPLGATRCPCPIRAVPAPMSHVSPGALPEPGAQATGAQPAPSPTRDPQAKVLVVGRGTRGAGASPVRHLGAPQAGHGLLQVLPKVQHILHRPLPLGLGVCGGTRRWL